MTQSNSLLPPNATQLQKDLEAATTLRLLSLNVDALRYLNDPDNCLEEFLPWIAWAMSVDIWNNDWEAVTKRKVVRESLLVHRQKGTLGALRRTLESFLFARIRITEWFEYNGEPYTFRVYAVYREAGMSLSDAELIYAAIMQAKNLRSHLEFFMPQIETESKAPRYGVAFGHLEKTTIYPREENV